MTCALGHTYRARSSKFNWLGGFHQISRINVATQKILQKCSLLLHFVACMWITDKYILYLYQAHRKTLQNYHNVQVQLLTKQCTVKYKSFWPAYIHTINLLLLAKPVMDSINKVTVCYVTHNMYSKMACSGSTKSLQYMVEDVFEQNSPVITALIKSHCGQQITSMWLVSSRVPQVSPMTTQSHSLAISVVWHWTLEIVYKMSSTATICEIGIIGDHSAQTVRPTPTVTYKRHILEMSTSPWNDFPWFFYVNAYHDPSLMFRVSSTFIQVWGSHNRKTPPRPPELFLCKLFKPITRHNQVRSNQRVCLSETKWYLLHVNEELHRLHDTWFPYGTFPALFAVMQRQWCLRQEQWQKQ